MDAKNPDGRQRCLDRVLALVPRVIAAEGGSEARVVRARGADVVGEGDGVEDRHLGLGLGLGLGVGLGLGL